MALRGLPRSFLLFSLLTVLAPLVVYVFVGVSVYVISGRTGVAVVLMAGLTRGWRVVWVLLLAVCFFNLLWALLGRGRQSGR